MNETELKPVAVLLIAKGSKTVWQYDLSERTEFSDGNYELCAIPDTHRVVSVETLEWIADSCANTDAETALRAIIDNKGKS